MEYLFFLLTALALIVLRIKDRGIERPFVAPLYPWMPLFFCAWCAFMLYGSIEYAGSQALCGLVLLLVGVPLYYLSRMLGTAPPQASPRPLPPANGTKLETGFRSSR